MARRRLPLSAHEKADTLEHLRICRARMIDVQRVTPINGPEYKAAEHVNEASDAFAEVLTGNREHFWLQLAPSRCPRCQDSGWICEEHRGTYPHDDCSGPGEPCPVCDSGEPPRPPKGFVSLVRRA
jgi:hypothetical protein